MQLKTIWKTALRCLSLGGENETVRISVYDPRPQNKAAQSLEPGRSSPRKREGKRGRGGAKAKALRNWATAWLRVQVWAADGAALPAPGLARSPVRPEGPPSSATVSGGRGAAARGRAWQRRRLGERGSVEGGAPCTGSARRAAPQPSSCCPRVCERRPGAWGVSETQWKRLSAPSPPPVSLFRPYPRHAQALGLRCRPCSLGPPDLGGLCVSRQVFRGQPRPCWSRPALDPNPHRERLRRCVCARALRPTHPALLRFMESCAADPR